MTARQRNRLQIRCTGRRVNKSTFRPVGRTCGRLFTSTGSYRSRDRWIEMARAAGWRVSPLRPDNTVNATCPACVTGTRSRTPKEQ